MTTPSPRKPTYPVLMLAALAAIAPNFATAVETQSKPVVLVIANEDFHHAEYAATRAALESRGLRVVVAAGEVRLARPQGYRVGGTVLPDLALSRVTASDHAAVVFVGGWGASAYQYAIAGTYQHAAYRPQPAITREVNRIVGAFSAAGKPVAGLSHGVTVLAWARVDGTSPLRGRIVVGPAGGMPAIRIGATIHPDAEQPARWQIEANGATMLTSGSIGNPLSTTDDVVVDGRIITAENVDAAGRFAELLAQSVAANRD